MPKIWKTYKLSEVADKIGSGSTPRGGKEAYLEQSDISLIRSQNVLDFFFSTNGLAFISDEQAYELRNVAIEEDDILLNITGDSVARVCKVPDYVIPARVNQHVAIIRANKSKLDSEFLKYYLLEPSFKRYMLGLASAGATRNALTKVMIENFEINAPELKTQSQIASILSSLDNKIELNLQMNQTLEAMAQAVFKEWFVDFNLPAGQAGFPGSSKKLVNGLPKGWSLVSIGELFESTIGGDWGQEELSDEFPVHVSVVRGTDFSDILNGSATRVPLRYIKEKNFEKRAIQHGDLLLEISGGSKDQPTGRTILFTNELLSLFPKPVVPASFCRLIRPLRIEESVFLNTFFNLFYSMGGTWEYQNQSTGLSNFQFTYFSENKKLALPDDRQLIIEFGKIVSPMLNKMHENLNQIQILTQTRDSLLPKLMNGTIEVKA